MAALGLCCCMWAFSSCRQQGLLSSYTTRASHCGGFSSCGAWAVGHVGSVLVAHRLSCSTACGSFLDQGSNPYPLHWQADSSPLSHQGSPSDPFFIFFFFFLFPLCPKSIVYMFFCAYVFGLMPNHLLLSEY